MCKMLQLIGYQQCSPPNSAAPPASTTLPSPTASPATSTMPNLAVYIASLRHIVGQVDGVSGRRGGRGRGKGLWK